MLVNLLPEVAEDITDACLSSIFDENFTVGSIGDSGDEQLPREEAGENLQAEIHRLSDALEESRDREFELLELLGNISNPICLLDKNGVITFANVSFCDFFWLRRTQVTGAEFLPLLNRENRDPVCREFELLTPEEPFRQSSCPLYGATILNCWEQWSIRAFFDDKGSPKSYQILGPDLSSLGEFKGLSNPVQPLFENSRIGFAYSEDLVIKKVCPYLCGLLGYQENELLGKKIPFREMYLENDEKNMLEIAQRLNKDENSFRELGLRTKGGKIIETFILTIPTQLKTGGRGHYFFIQDIRERKEFEKQHLRTELIASRSPLVLFQGRKTNGVQLDYVSENVRQFGYRPEDLMVPQAALNSLVHPEDLPVLLSLSERDDQEGKVDREYTYRFRRADGQYRWINQKSRIGVTRDSGPELQVGLIMDVTKQKEAEKAAIESHQLLEEKVTLLEKAWEQTIGTLAAVTELRDPYTMGHQRRVAHLSGAIAEEMGMDEELVQETIRAGLVHDIGKIQIPSDFLSKPGKLTSTEFALIQEHPRAGAKLLEKIDLPWRLAPIVAQHHERMDGSGYPNGLSGDQILLPARIIAVADVVEAMASHRPYRPALGIAEALREISSKAGTLYDPEAAAACQVLFLEKGYRWIEE